MKERPIIFSGPMVRAILDGRKTQTRRVVKNQDWPDDFEDPHQLFDGQWVVTENNPPGILINYPLLCPYHPGDRLWVRETWRPESESDTGAMGIRYRADAHYEDGFDVLEYLDGTDRWQPSIHMPRKFSRLTLRITDVRVQRVQRVQEICGADCMAEGVLWDADAPMIGPCEADAGDLIEQFGSLWDSINGRRRGAEWADNPWVWVVSFEVLR